MRSTALPLLVVLVAACGAYQPAVANPAAAHECSASRPLKYTGATALLAVVGISMLHDANHPSPRMYDQYGMETLSSDFTPGPDVTRFAGYGALGLAAIGAAVATIEWVDYEHCQRE